MYCINYIVWLSFLVTVRGSIWENPDDIFGGWSNDEVSDAGEDKIPGLASEESVSNHPDLNIKECICKNDLLIGLANKIQKALLFSEENSDLDVSLPLSFFKQEVNLLKLYFLGKATSKDAEKVILKSLTRKSFHWHSYLPRASFLESAFNKLTNFLSKPEVAIALMAMALLFSMVWCLVHFRSPRIFVFVVFSIVFIVSYGWNWNHHYKEALAKSEQVLLEMNYELPSHCIPSSRTFLQRLSSYVLNIFSPDYYSSDCLKFMKEKHLEPMARVNPGVVFIDTLSVVFFQPLKAVSYTIKEMSHILSETFPIGIASVMKTFLTFMLTGFFLMLFAWLFVSLFSEHFSINLLNIFSIRTGNPASQSIQPNRRYLEYVGPEKGVIKMDSKALKSLCRGSNSESEEEEIRDKPVIKRNVRFERHISAPSFAPQLRVKRRTTIKRRNSLDSYFQENHLNKGL